MLELTLVERELGKKNTVWAEAAERHYQSAKRAIDQLVASQGDFETEGELTFVGWNDFLFCTSDWNAGIDAERRKGA